MGFGTEVVLVVLSLGAAGFLGAAAGVFSAALGAGLEVEASGSSSGSSTTLGAARSLGAGRGSSLFGAGMALGGSLGAVLVFQAGLTLGAPWDRVAVTLMKSWSKKMSKLMLGIWKSCVHRCDCECVFLLLVWKEVVEQKDRSYGKELIRQSGACPTS